MSLKKILVLSSYGGYGHIAATNTLKKLLGENYLIEAVYPIKELRFFGVPAGESFYNWLLSNNLNRIINWIVRHISKHLFIPREKKTIALIQKHIEEKKPDLLISVIPFVNYPAAEAAKNANIPFLLITTDNDLSHWVLGFEKIRAKNFKIIIGNRLKTTDQLLETLGIKNQSIVHLGLPLRPHFFNLESREELRAKYEIPINKNVVLIMMGGMGARSTYQYVKALVGRSLNLHLLVCTGRNRHLAKKLKAIQSATSNTIDVIPFTDKVHELFALSDLLLTKPGPGTINEAYALKLPLLIDRTQTPLLWEQANIDLVLRDQVGQCIDHYDEAPDLVARFLFDEQTRETVSRAYKKIEENRFATEIAPLVDELCEKTPEQQEILTSQI